jgi:hypothetical protein
MEVAVGGIKGDGSLITIKVNKLRDRSLIYSRLFIHSHKFIKIYSTYNSIIKV